MKQYLGLPKRFLILATSLVASSVFTTSPSQAVTFASSKSELTFTNFSQNPSATLSNIETNPISIDRGGTVATNADATAFFEVNPPKAFNSSFSLAKGENGNYLGLADSLAVVIGTFDITENTLFSFNFAGNFNLQTSIDNSSAENAIANGDISFALIDVANNNIFDFFNLSGNLTTQGNNDFLEFDNSSNVTLNNFFNDGNVGGKQEFITASFDGSVQRYFSNKTTLALLEVKKNQVRVSAPEPSTTLALIFTFGAIVFTVKRKK